MYMMKVHIDDEYVCDEYCTENFYTNYVDTNYDHIITRNLNIVTDLELRHYALHGTNIDEEGYH